MSFPLLPLAHALTELVPLIARWLGRENGHATAQKVVNIAQSITREKEPLQILHSLKADSKKALEFQQAVQKMAHELDLEEVKDRENARLRDIALAQAGRSNLRADIMVISAALGLIACLVTITLYRMSLPGEAVGIISTVAGIFGSCLKDAYAFEFGSSRGSKMKDTKLSAFFLAKQPS
ncbi:MAG: hypothetical protein KA112_00020 [Alphaproteobacteria bacterium]|jgi:Flp pilus assembly protein TadB|nr:hypothetical protein [Alphaproteobacteria bacterium]MBP7728988.1 hypothetical protein [Alphaproteobacteria bacterium]